MHGDDFIGLLAVLIIFGGPITYFIINRLFTHNERMELLKRGIIPPEDVKKGRVYGPPFTPGAQPPQMMQPMYYPDLQAQATLRKGISITAVGFALTFGLSFIGFGPWLLGGLVPMFVGIAQIIIAVMSGAQFGPVQRMQSFGPPPPHTDQPSTPPPYANSSSTAGPAPTGPPYGWRPPSGVPEIERGPKPPDVK